MTGWQLRGPEAPSSRWTEFLSKAQTRHCWDSRSRTTHTIHGKPKVIRLRKKYVNLRSDSTCLMQEGRTTNAFEAVGSRKAPWGHPLHLHYPWSRTSFQPPSPWNAACPALHTSKPRIPWPGAAKNPWLYPVVIGFSHWTDCWPAWWCSQLWPPQSFPVSFHISPHSRLH